MPEPVTVLHYLGYDRDDGGIVSVVRTLAATGKFTCVLGVNPGFEQRRMPPLATREFPTIAGETLGLKNFWRARRVAQAVRDWLAESPGHVFHGRSRAGLAVALWLHFSGERRVVASVHAYGRRRWFYRWASRRLKERLIWLTPAMKSHYGVEQESGGWACCIPDGVALPARLPERKPPELPLRVVRLVGVGTLISLKRWHLVLEALHRVPPAVRNKFRFTHVGGTDGSEASTKYAAALRVQAAALGLDRLVEWRGDQPVTPELLQDMDCLVSPAHREALSVARLEALAAGVPVLAANSGGARDLIHPSRNGWLFRSGDPDDLARMLIMLAESDALLSVRPTLEDLRPFSAPVVADEWARVYARVIADAK